MSDWDLPLLDYWDQTTGAINRNARRLIHLGEAEQAAACDQIRAAVRRRLHALADDQLLQAAVSMADDLYKFVNDEVLIDGALFAYLDAFARTFTTMVRERGHVIHYVVENQFSGVDFLMRGPFDLFPRVFNAAGFVYVCPQHLALQLMQVDGVAAPDYAEVITQYIDEARVVGERLVSRCLEMGHHYVFLEADYQEGALDVALQDGGAGGVLIIFRNDAPVPDSTVSVRFPESLTCCQRRPGIKEESRLPLDAGVGERRFAQAVLGQNQPNPNFSSHSIGGETGAGQARGNGVGGRRVE